MSEAQVPVEPEDDFQPPTLKDRVARFNTITSKHAEGQAINPFSQDANVKDIQKRRFSKEEYGRPKKGSKSETRAFKANVEISREMLELCEIIDHYAEPLFTPEEKLNDPRKVISFGELFSIYVAISNKLVGILLRARKQKLVDFEGEVLFQRQDDHIPIILSKPIEEIRNILKTRIKEALAMIEINESPLDDRELP